MKTHQENLLSSKFTGGKNEKPRRGVLREKLSLHLYFVSRKKLAGKENN